MKSPTETSENALLISAVTTEYRLPLSMIERPGVVQILLAILKYYNWMCALRMRLEAIPADAPFPSTVRPAYLGGRSRPGLKLMSLIPPSSEIFCMPENTLTKALHVLKNKQQCQCRLIRLQEDTQFLQLAVCVIKVESKTFPLSIVPLDML